LQETGDKDKIIWNQAYGGTISKAGCNFSTDQSGFGKVADSLFPIGGGWVAHGPLEMVNDD